MQILNDIEILSEDGLLNWIQVRRDDADADEKNGDIGIGKSKGISDFDDDFGDSADSGDEDEDDDDDEDMLLEKELHIQRQALFNEA